MGGGTLGQRGDLLLRARLAAEFDELMLRMGARSRGRQPDRARIVVRSVSCPEW